ncbi:hypothetical protein QYM36_016407, partial [Artemia franciscana]
VALPASVGSATLTVKSLFSIKKLHMNLSPGIPSFENLSEKPCSFATCPKVLLNCSFVTGIPTFWQSFTQVTEVPQYLHQELEEKVEVEKILQNKRHNSEIPLKGQLLQSRKIKGNRRYYVADPRYHSTK